MNDLFVSLLVILATGALVALIFVFTGRARKQSAEALRRMADARGWTCEPVEERLRRGTRLRGPGWALEALSVSSGHSPEPSQVDVAQSTTLQAPSFTLNGRVALIGPRPGGGAALGGLGQMLMDKAAQMFLGTQAANLAEVQAGSAELRERFLLLAQDPADMRALLSPGAESLLESWQGSLPVIKVTAQGLRIDIRGQHYKKESEILNLVSLAEALMKKN